MSAPANKEALDQLEKIVEENDKAGDWLFSSFPGSVIPMRVEGPMSSEDIVNLTGNLPAPPKPKQ